MGYYANTYFSRDKIRIEYMHLVGKNKDPIEKKDILKLEKCLHVGNFGFGAFALFDNPGEPLQNRWKHLEGYLRNSKIIWEYLIEEINSLDKDTKSDRMDIPANMQFYLSRLGVPLHRHSPENAGDHFENGRQGAKNCIDDLDKMIEILSNQNPKQRTDEVDLVVTLLNAGDTDGLIHSDGKMMVSGIEKSLDITFQPNFGNVPLNSSYWYSLYGNTHGVPKTGYTPTGIKVEKRSMISVIFSIIPDAQGTLKTFVKGERLIKFTVELKDFEGRTITEYKEMIARYTR